MSGYLMPFLLNLCHNFFFYFCPASLIFLEAISYAVLKISHWVFMKSSVSSSNDIPIAISTGSLGYLPNIKYGDYPVESCVAELYAMTKSGRYFGHPFFFSIVQHTHSVEACCAASVALVYSWLVPFQAA